MIVQNHLKLADQISATLGWGDMLIHVALPAIDRIMCNYVSLNCDVFGISGEEVESSLEQVLSEKSSDFLWDQLFLSEACDTREKLIEPRMFRGEIEMYMRKGYTFEESCAEWLNK